MPFRALRMALAPLIAINIPQCGNRASFIPHCGIKPIFRGSRVHLLERLAQGGDGQLGVSPGIAGHGRTVGEVEAFVAERAVPVVDGAGLRGNAHGRDAQGAGGSVRALEEWAEVCRVRTTLTTYMEAILQ